LGLGEVQPQFQGADQTSQALSDRIYRVGIDVLPHSKDHKYRFVGNNTLYKEIGVEAISFHASAVGFVKIGKKAEQVFAFDDGKLSLVILEPFQFVNFVKLKFSGEAGWRSRTHIHPIST
jgi:hypothetical protein